jgi:elongation factor G
MFMFRLLVFLYDTRHDRARPPLVTTLAYFFPLPNVCFTFFPVVDFKVTLVDGKAHSVDSSDAAFQTAGALALREAAADVKIHLLEPVAEVTVLVGDDYVGSVMSDLSGRRGRVVGTEQAGGGRTLVRAEVPEIEIDRYAVDLRSLSHGTARFDRRYARHEPMPPQIAAKVREQAEGAA